MRLGLTGGCLVLPGFGDGEWLFSMWPRPCSRLTQLVPRVTQRSEDKSQQVSWVWFRLSGFSHFLHSIGQRVPGLRDQEKGPGKEVEFSVTER